jgi:hypothetical protein
VQPPPIAPLWQPGVHVTAVSPQLWFPVQCTSHPHDAPHEMPCLHDWTPEHSTSQREVPHVTPSHEPLPVHSTLHDVVPAHDTSLRHALSVSHFTSHAQPGGHTTLSVQSEPFAQSITHECAVTSQVEQFAGQLLPESPCDASALPTGASIISVPATTQNPSTQSRPVLQSAVFVHEKSPLLCVIEQLAASANTNAT